VTRTESEQLGKLGSKVLDRAEDTARQAGELAREKKDEIVEKVDHQVSEGGTSSEGASASETRTQEFGAA